MGVKVREKIKGSNEWWIFIDHQGKRRSKKVGKDKRAAILAAQKIEAKLVLGDFGLLSSQENPMFKQYADTWINVSVPVKCKPSTCKDYSCFLDKYILPYFGNKEVKAINRFMIKSYLTEQLGQGKSSSTVNQMKSIISGIFNLAVDDEVINVNPAHRLGKMYTMKRSNESLDPLTRDELTHLLEVFRKHYPSHYPLALCLARTGMRAGEAFALQWGNIDFKNRFIVIKQSFSRGNLGTPKNGKSRKIDMSTQLCETLQNLRQMRTRETIKKGWGEIPEWVFITERGTYLDHNNWRNRIFNKALQKASMRQIRIHDLRHTYASLMIQAGESLAYVRDQLGHHSIQITVDIYGHLVPGGNKEAVDRLDDHAPIRTLSAPRS